MDRERLHQDEIDQTEDRGVGADPERERQQRDDGKRRRAAKQAERVGDVAAQLVQPTQSEGVAAMRLVRLDAAEIRAGLPVRVDGGQALAPQLGFVQVEMRLHLHLHTAVEGALAKRGSNPRSQPREDGHTSSGTAWSANPTAPENRCQ